MSWQNSRYAAICVTVCTGRQITFKPVSRIPFWHVGDRKYSIMQLEEATWSRARQMMCLGLCEVGKNGVSKLLATGSNPTMQWPRRKGCIENQCAYQKFLSNCQAQVGCTSIEVIISNAGVFFQKSRRNQAQHNYGVISKSRV
jgi:hypothetical protein